MNKLFTLILIFTIASGLVPLPKSYSNSIVDTVRGVMGEGGIVYAATTTNKATTTKVVKKPAFVPLSPKMPAIKDYTVSAWIPYWKGEQAVDEAVKNIKKIDIVSPFAYEVNETGVLQDKLKMNQEPFSRLLKAAQDNKKLIIPTILWTDKAAMQSTLADPELREVMISDILAEIKKYKFDGIDIDFEGKSAETRDDFSAFIIEAGKALHKNNKLLVCTLESRIPLDSRYATVTPELMKKIEYSNDFKAIAPVCDQVRFMAYDQMNADQKLVSQKGKDGFYKPVADIDWVEKVITLAMEDFKWKKIVIGVPTYGNKYEIVDDGKGGFKYKFIGSMNWYYANQKAEELGIKPERNAAGELSFTYTENGRKYLIWYSDSQAIADKVKIAKLYKVGGIAIFKVDGNNDPTIWKKI